MSEDSVVVDCRPDLVASVMQSLHSHRQINNFHKDQIRQVCLDVLNKLVATNGTVRSCLENGGPETELIVNVISDTVMDVLVSQHKKGDGMTQEAKTEKRAVVLTCAKNLLKLSSKGLEFFCVKLAEVAKSDREIGQLRRELRVVMDEDGDVDRASVMGNILLYMSFRALVDIYDERIDDHLRSAVDGEENGQDDMLLARSCARLGCDFLNLVLQPTDHVKIRATGKAEELFGDNTLTAREKKNGTWILHDGHGSRITALINLLIKHMKLSLTKSALSDWESCDVKTFAFTYNDFQQLLEEATGKEPDDVVVPEKVRGENGIDLGTGHDRVCISKTEWKSLIERAAKEAEKKGNPENNPEELLLDISAEVESSSSSLSRDQKEDEVQDDEESYSGEEFEDFLEEDEEGAKPRRISFSSDLTIHDIPKYSEEERVDLFYTSSEINSFLMEAAKEEYSFEEDEQNDFF